MRCIAAIDVGGTLTDISLADLDQGLLWATKTPTTPDDPSQGFASGIAKVLQQAQKTLMRLSRCCTAPPSRPT